MSSCLSGRAYVLDLENILKSSPCTASSRNSNSNSSSPSSILSESSNSLIAVSTRKPRTPRKRPNQTYNEAAALLSTACPAIFSVTKKHNNRPELPNQRTYFFHEPPELILIENPIDIKPREIKLNGRSTSRSPSMSSLDQSDEYQDDFDTESILDEEIGEGIDSIMGNPNSNSNSNSNEKSYFGFKFDFNYKTCYGYPVAFGLRNGVRALKNVDGGDWWSIPAVNMMNVSPPAMKKSEKYPAGKKKKVAELMKSEPEYSIGDGGFEKGNRLLLKLNYEKILKAWSDKGSPVPEGLVSLGSDVHSRLAQIDLFSENGGVRKASMTRYKEKRRTRFYSKKIRYQVRKVNADLRPRSKGRFVRRPNSPTCEET